MFLKMLQAEVSVQPRGSLGPKGGVPRGRVPGAAGLAAFMLAVASMVVVTPAGAVAIVALDGDGLAAQGVTAAPAMKGVPTKLTMGLAALSAEYQAYKQAVTNGTARAGTFSTKKTMARVVGEMVVIDAVAADDPEALRASLEALGAEVTAVAGRIVSARVPLDRLPDLEYLDTLKFARPAVAATHTGAVTSQGDVAQASDLARTTFGVDGAGSTVGILSDSFNCLGGYAADIGTGDLPAGVNNLSDVTTDCIDEGRAMAQIVYDVAPGAGLAFHTAWNGEADFAQGILDLAAAGSSIIVDDVYYVTEPWFQDGVIAQAVDQVKALGVPYFSSAGNSGRRSYQAAFVGSGLTGYIGGELHDFDPGPGVDTRLTIQQNGTTRYAMQWRDRFFSVSGAPGAASDLDICAYDPVGAAVPIWCEAFGNIGGDPIEWFILTGARTLEISIERWSGAAPNPVKVMFYGNIAFGETYAGTSASTIVGHANAGGANAVGASAFFLTPAFGEDPPVLNYYSSVGNTPILFDTAGNPVNQIRQKPQFTAPDGGNNTFFGSDTAEDADTWPNFFGTSAAAPHAAGVAALLREVIPTATPNGITTALQNTAVDMLQRETVSFGGPRVAIGTGFDNSSGAGLIDAFAAVATIGHPAGVGMWRPGTGRFYLDVNVSYTWNPGTDVVTVPFGASTDLPVSGDWNGDGQTDVGVWRPGTGRFYLDVNGNYLWDPGTDVITVAFGISTDRPVSGDWNGDGQTDVGVWRPGTGRFYLDVNGNYLWDPGTDAVTVPFGLSSDRPVSGDWNGDGLTDVGVWRPSTGRFYLDANGNYTWDPNVDVVTVPFGVASDLPVAGIW